MIWWRIGKECLRCNNLGLVPVLEYYSTKGVVLPTVVMYECGCLNTKEFWTTKESWYVDNRSGKRQKTTTKVFYCEKYETLVSQGNLKWNGFQFPWTNEIMRLTDPWIDYYEVFVVYNYYNSKKNKESGNPEIITDLEVLENYVTSYRKLKTDFRGVVDSLSPRS